MQVENSQGTQDEHYHQQLADVLTAYQENPTLIESLSIIDIVKLMPDPENFLE
jgi:hypothetical protein